MVQKSEKEEGKECRKAECIREETPLVYTTLVHCSDAKGDKKNILIG
jgi:hypothetical protein